MKYWSVKCTRIERGGGEGWGGRETQLSPEGSPLRASRLAANIDMSQVPPILALVGGHEVVFL